MTRRSELPTPFDAVPFRVAEALDAGISRNRLDARDLVRSHHGARTRAPVDFRGRCEALVPLMSSTQAFTGPTAALLLDLPLPLLIDRDRRLHVSSLQPQRGMRRPGIVAEQRPYGEVRLLGRLPVLDAELVWISLGRCLGLADMVAVGDRLVTGTLTTPELSSLARLEDAVAASSGRPGVAAARAALPLLRVGAWSRPETFVRLLIRSAGLPEPRLNQPVVLDGGRMAIPDLAWPDFQVAVEYDGAWHRQQGNADADRHERLVDRGWVIVRIRADELFRSPGDVVARLLRRLSDRGYRHPRPIDMTQTPRFVA